MTPPSRYNGGQCLRDDCPRARLGHGAWHIALPKLQALSKAQLKNRYPRLNIYDLQDHVEKNGQRHYERRADRRRECDQIRGEASGARRKPRQPESPPQVARKTASALLAEIKAQLLAREKNEASSSTEENPTKRRRLRQPESRPPNGASSSTGGNPVRLQPVVLDSSGADRDGDGYDSGFTILSSDDSEASVFGLRSALHEVEADDELSDSSSQGNGDMAVAEKERASKWRMDNFLQYNLDFAYVFKNFEEAYYHAGRAVAVAWSKARKLAEPWMVTDVARVSEVEATASKICKVDEQKKAQAIKRKRPIDASSLRQPGEGTQMEEEQDDKARFLEPLAQLMMDCGVGRTENASAADEEIMTSHRRKATRVVKANGIPTLHKAIITADELRKHLESRPMHMDVNKVEPVVLEEFLWQSHAPGRAFNAIGWMCKNLQLEWPIGGKARHQGGTFD